MATNTSEATAHGAVEAVSSGPAMPQLDPSTYSNQIFWLVVCLVAVYFLLSKIALPRIGGVLEQRSQTIQRDLDRAADMKAKAEEAEANYHQALKDARTKANEIAEGTRAEIQKDLDAAIAKADAKIAVQTEKSSARIAEMQAEAETSIKTIAADVAVSLVETISPSSADDKLIGKMLDKVLKG